MNSTDDENTGCWGHKMPPEEKRKLVGPQYIATKVVNARLMTLGEFNEIHPGQMFKGKTPEDEGYQVTYPQIGTEEPYQGWCPKAQFEAQNQDPRKGMTFGHALEMMKHGYRVKRIGENVIFSLGTRSLIRKTGVILPGGSPVLIRETPIRLVPTTPEEKPEPESADGFGEFGISVEMMLKDDWVLA